jgi:hypothetical protein
MDAPRQCIAEVTKAALRAAAGLREAASSVS